MTKNHPVLTVYGATSYTASNHLLPYLANHVEAAGFHLILAGRNADKLAAIDAQLPSIGPRREIVVLRLEDEGGVGSLVERSDVIVNFAGPYQSHGAERLIKSCAHHGTHYLDLCGEINYIAKMCERYDYMASKTGAIIIPACGFESAPADLVVYNALRTLQQHAGRDQGLRTSTNFYDLAGGVSGGTIASVGAVGDSGEGMNPKFQYALCPIHEQPAERPKFELVKRSPVRVSGAPTIGAFFVGEVVNLPVVRRSWFLSRLDTRQLRVAVQDSPEPRHSADTQFSEAFTSLGPMHATNIITAYLYSIILLVTLGIYAASSVVRDALAKWIPQPGEGPSMEDCLKGHTRITNVSKADNGLAIITKYDGAGDPGYSHTGKIIAEAALSLILPPPKGYELPTLAKTGGVLTPSTGIGSVLVERLRLYNVATIQSEIVEVNSEGKKNV